MPALFRAIGIFALLTLASCGSSSDAPRTNADLDRHYPPESGGTLIDAMSAEPSSLLAMLAGESASSSVASNIFNSLLKYDKNLELEGELAQSWQVSGDQKTITFKLKPDMKWADGAPLTSTDVLFTWQVMTDDNTQTPYGADYKLVKHAEAPDPFTFRVTYEQPYAPALSSWAGLQVLPKHLLEGQNINTTTFARKPVGSHYYQLAEWKHGEHISLTRNPNATQGQARIDRLVSRFIPDPAAQFLELMADNIDTMNLNPIQSARILPAREELNQRVALYKELGNAYTYLGFNLKHAPFDDKRVRQAINYAINKQELIDGVLLGLGEPVASPYKPGTRWSNPELHPYPHDIEKAKQLLKEAGFEDHDGDGILDKNGQPFQFEILTNQNPDRVKAATFIQRQLKQVGIKVSIRQLEWASFIGRYIKTGDFQAVVLGWSLGAEPDQFNIWHSSQQAPGQFNFIGYNNPEVDRLLEQGRLELDPDKRMKIYHQFAKILLDDSPMVYLYAGYELAAIHKRVQGVDNTSPPAGIGYNSYEWYIPAPLRRDEISARNEISDK
ncbi:MAG: peptide-binding protein [Methylobacillus sp.]|jgi:peptide/nickel transport system substrate-binding protein|nr:peptide-binding protein [Methylobacillus sp.]